VVGATVPLGTIVVRKLLLRNYRVRALVPDLYSSTLDTLGTGVTYAVGKLSDPISLEYALTDIDKVIIIFPLNADDEESVRGLSNLASAWMNTRTTDYGMGQAVKRTLFKFKKGERSDPTGIFTIDGGSGGGRVKWTSNVFGHGVFVGTMYGRRDTATVVSTRLRSREDDGVTLSDQGLNLKEYAGLILRICADGSSFTVVVRTGEYERSGVEYECTFTTEHKTGSRTVANNNSEGVETGEELKRERRPSAKFTTVRIPFVRFVPVWSEKKKRDMYIRKEDLEEEEFWNNRPSPPHLSDYPLDISDVRLLGFRFRRGDNVQRGYKRSNRFYLSISYIKLYRSQLEPEVVLVSDAAIPCRVTPDMLRHDQKKIVRMETEIESNRMDLGDMDDYKILEVDESDDQSNEKQRSYYKFMGEQVLRNSGMTYTIVRVKGYNERASIKSSIKIQQVRSENKNKSGP